jgi:DNA adenine methylase
MSRYKTPLRYPGGKQKLSPFIAELIEENGLAGGHYVEPYAGGAGVAIELLFGGQASHIHLNDSCKGVYAFWRAVLNQTEELCSRISRAALTVDEWRRQRLIFAKPSAFSQIDVGFSTFFLNRCNRSGILSGGLIGGLAQDGEWNMDARFPRNELIRRIESIALKRKAISVRGLDAEQFIREHLPVVPETALVYLDPPYFRKADRLYLNHYAPADHARIARVIQREIRHQWVVSYDNAPEIISFFAKRRSFEYSLQYNASRAYIGKEIVVVSDALRIPKASKVGGINEALSRVGKMGSHSTETRGSTHLRDEVY